MLSPSALLLCLSDGDLCCHIHVCCGASVMVIIVGAALIHHLILRAEGSRLEEAACLPLMMMAWCSMGMVLLSVRHHVQECKSFLAAVLTELLSNCSQHIYIAWLLMHCYQQSGLSFAPLMLTCNNNLAAILANTERRTIGSLSQAEWRSTCVSLCP